MIAESFGMFIKLKFHSVLAKTKDTTNHGVEQQIMAVFRSGTIYVCYKEYKKTVRDIAIGNTGFKPPMICLAGFFEFYLNGDNIKHPVTNLKFQI